jgi:hypothetical protein
MGGVITVLGGGGGGISAFSWINSLW